MHGGQGRAREGARGGGTPKTHISPNRLGSTQTGTQLNPSRHRSTISRSSTGTPAAGLPSGPTLPCHPLHLTTPTLVTLRWVCMLRRAS